MNRHPQLLIAGLLLAIVGCDAHEADIVIGSRNFTESIALGALVGAGGVRPADPDRHGRLKAPWEQPQGR